MFSFHILCFKTEKEKILLLLLFFFKIEKKTVSLREFSPDSLARIANSQIHSQAQLQTQRTQVRRCQQSLKIQCYRRVEY